MLVLGMGPEARTGRQERVTRIPTYVCMCLTDLAGDSFITHPDGAAYLDLIAADNLI